MTPALPPHEQLAGRDANAIGHRRPAQHTGDLLDPRLFVEPRHGGPRPAGVDALLDLEVRVGGGGNLRQVRDAQYLKCGPERAQFRADDISHPPADAGIDLVEDQPRGLGASGPPGGIGEASPRGRRQRLDGQHNPRELAARNDPRQRPQILPRVRRHEELDPIDPVGRPRLCLERVGGEADLEARALHRELGQQGFELPGEISRDVPARPGESLRRSQIPVAGARMLPLELDDALVVMLELGQLLAQRLALRDDVAKRRAILPLEPLQERQSVVDLLEPGRRGLDAVGIPPQKEREVLELRFDAVARLEIRLEFRIQRGELCHPAPDAAEVRQRGAVALIQRRVALGAQPLDALGAREHLPGRRQLDVFARLPRLEGRSIELAELKGRELLTRGAIRRGAPDVSERVDSRLK